MPSRSLVLEHLPAFPQDVHSHFSHKLGVETDPWDVYSDIQAGLNEFLIIDPRTPAAYEDAHITGAISLPHREIDEATTAGFSKDTLIVVYGWGPACNAPTKAGLRLSNLGFSVKEMIGGFEYWVREGFPIEGARTSSPDLYGRAPQAQTS